jgi:tetratricopeptide (TPR) repeat protein
LLLRVALQDMDTQIPSMPRRRLASWKEIAAFFGRDERTVRRWEKQRSMPVHRLPGGDKGGVFAFTDELAEWLKTRGASEADILVRPPVEAAFSENGAADSGSGNGARVARWPFGLPVFRIKTGLIFGAAMLTLLISAAVIEQRYRESGHLLVSAASGSRRVDPEAADLYLKGRYYWNKRTPDDLNKAVGYFTQAIVRDPGYARAYVGLADCYNLLGEYTAMPPGETHARAYAAAKRAVELDDSSAEAHTTLGFATLYWKWDQMAAEHEFQRAIALDPNDPQAHHWYATSLMVFGRPQEGLAQINLAQSVDPSSTAILADKGLIAYYSGHQEEGLAILKQLENSDPSFASPHRYLAAISLDAGDYPTYLMEQKKMALLLHDQQELAIISAAEKGFSAGGYRGMLESMLPEQEKFYSQGTLPAYSLATTYARLGRKKESLQHLQTSYDQRENNFLNVKGDHAFDGLHDGPAFQELAARSSMARPD